MIFTMAGKIAPAGPTTRVLKPYRPVARTGCYFGQVKINQVGIICGCSLGAADAMRIMAGIAWRVFVGDVLEMIPEVAGIASGFIGEISLIMAGKAKRIGSYLALRIRIGCYVLLLQDMCKS
jgi:hypothetical protein